MITYIVLNICILIKKIIAKISSVFMDLLTLSSLIVKGMKPSKIVEGKLLKKLSSIHITFLSLP